MYYGVRFLNVAGVTVVETDVVVGGEVLEARLNVGCVGVVCGRSVLSCRKEWTVESTRRWIQNVAADNGR